MLAGFAEFEADLLKTRTRVGMAIARGTNRERPGMGQVLAAVRAGDTLMVPKLDRLARSVPDARDIGDTLVARGVRQSLGGSIYDPADPMSKMFW